MIQDAGKSGPSVAKIADKKSAEPSHSGFNEGGFNHVKNRISKIGQVIKGRTARGSP